MILNRSIDAWVDAFPLIEDMMNYKESFWMNPKYIKSSDSLKLSEFTISDIVNAESRLNRFAPFIQEAFPETVKTDGLVESELTVLAAFNEPYKVYLKCDHKLPISGSIKARGGIYEILRYAESLLFDHNLLHITDNYDVFSDESLKRFFRNYTVVVSSTGNLGLSIGIISAALGFKVSVHMSHDAMEWKKKRLREIGCTVIEHESDYSKAVEIGRNNAEKDPSAYFVDDENSKHLFMGYAVAALRLRDQLSDLNIVLTVENPLFVYLPCGVGGGPGGVAYGLKTVFGDCVHCIFVEPTHAPCMLLGMMTSEHDRLCVQDFNMDNETIADGLAVGRASKFVGKVMENMLFAISTVEDDYLLTHMKKIYEQYNIFLEPSAVAGFKGLQDMINLKLPVYGEVLIKPDMILNGHHIVWATGGSMVPNSTQLAYLNS